MKLKLFYSDGGNHPVLGRVFFMRQECSGKGEDRYQRYIANTLSSIANSVDECDEVLSEIDDVESGYKNSVEIDGNDVEVLVGNKNVQVNITANEDWVDQLEGQFQLTQFKQAVEAWRYFLTLPESLSSEVTVDI